MLVIFEIALACAVLCNAVFMIGQRMSDMHLPNAIDEQGIVVVSMRGGDAAGAAGSVPRDLEALRSIAGVQAAGSVTSVPLDNNGQNDAFGTSPDARMEDAASVTLEYSFLGEGADKALGLHLLQGRFFTAEEYANSSLRPELMPRSHVAIITQSLAQRIWPGQSAIGKVMYSKPLWYTVVGVIADVLCSNDAVRSGGDRGFYYGAFFPIDPAGSVGAFSPANPQTNYVLRSLPAERDRVLGEAVRRLKQLNPAAVIQAKRFTDVRDQYFADNASVAITLAVICVIMLLVTAFGIVGLTSFWVRQRRRQIGIRRAIGASRRQVVYYFQTENFLLSTIGVMLGMALAFGINLYLMQHYQMQHMPWYYLPAGALTLWLLGQLAVLGPALRAAQVPPMVATRAA
nr:FtsX-like permease family protein [Dyella mobilis]